MKQRGISYTVIEPMHDMEHNATTRTIGEQKTHDRYLKELRKEERKRKKGERGKNRYFKGETIYCSLIFFCPCSFVLFCQN